MSGIYSTPWVRRAIDATERAHIEAILPPAYGVWLGADSPRGPFTAFLVRDHTRVEASRSCGRTARQAVELAVRTLDPANECWVCHRDLARLPWVNVQVEGNVIVRVCDICIERADEGKDWVTYG